jgi:hypothetical protein
LVTELLQDAKSFRKTDLVARLEALLANLM